MFQNYETSEVSSRSRATDLISLDLIAVYSFETGFT